MEIPYLTLPTSGSKLLELVYLRIDELKAELRDNQLAEKKFEEESMRQQQLVDQDVTEIGCGTFQAMPQLKTSGRSSKKLERIISSLYTVCSFIEPDHQYSLTLTDLIRLDLFTDTQTNFTNF
jgi:hypothetical protein